MSDHGKQLRWKGQLEGNPNPPCQHPENTHLCGRVLNDSFQIPRRERRLPWRLLHQSPRLSVQHYYSHQRLATNQPPTMHKHRHGPPLSTITILTNDDHEGQIIDIVDVYKPIILKCWFVSIWLIQIEDVILSIII